MSFAEAFAHTMADFEGGYANNAKDRGKETYRGVSRKSWPGWPGWKLIDAAKAAGTVTAKAINAKFKGSPEMARLVEDFYRVNFWDKTPAEFPGVLREKHFDTSINMGREGAGEVLQTALNTLGNRLAVDGAVGPLTRAAAAKASLAALIPAYCKAQAERYRAIVRRYPSQEEFLNGWLRRAAWVPPERKS
jgi:lysozyme family protein